MSTTEEDARRGRKLEQVRALLDKAASTTFDAEADALRAKADELMVSYGIEELELRFARKANERERPVVQEIRISTDYLGYELHIQLSQLFYSLARHVGVIVAPFSSYRTAKVIGWRRDLEYLELMYTNLQFDMVRKMDPQGDSRLTFDENVVMLKEAGLKWEEVFRRMRKAGLFPDGQEWERRIGVRFTGIYTRWCKEHGVTRHYASPTVYRRSFIEGYTTRINSRLREMAAARGLAGQGHELVLHNAEEDLKEFFYEMYPDRRPHPADCECEDCHFGKCNNKACTRPRCKRYWENYNKPVRGGRRWVEPKIDSSARQAGSSAADRADLSGAKLPSNPKEVK